jgi:hypothetical protein
MTATATRPAEVATTRRRQPPRCQCLGHCAEPAKVRVTLTCGPTGQLVLTLCKACARYYEHHPAFQPTILRRL